ncbi:MAG TPA: hypothetical protein VHB48_07095 [Chitinophagaceae bacterium]|nr:hypothetical protein [Chitinophagaceae bacterium]
MTLLLPSIIYGQNTNYSKIDKKYTDREQLINNIIPNKQILYWRYVETSSTKIIREAGNKGLLSNYKITIPHQGFFTECNPGYCYSYIIYIDTNGLNYITSENSLINFIGKIDNLSEAILVGKTQGLWIDTENSKGGSYIKTKTGFEMNLLKYNGCPETYESIFFKIGFDGKFKLKSKGIYKKTGACYIE